jgi:hydroxymethylbilane synthase
LQARVLRIGTRGSPLALAQAHEVRARLMAAHGLPEDAFEICTFKTTGDVIVDRPLAEVGGKGLFTKELEVALFAREIDLAVHSMKDMQTVLPDGLDIGAVLPREDVRDAFISLKYATLAELPEGAVVGTSSLRRQAQVKRMRPDLKVVGFRGNVQTRLGKLADGVADATLLACAGLKRLCLADRITSEIATAMMLPAVAQGAIAIEIGTGDAQTAEFIAPLNHIETAIRVRAERAFLRRLEGSCRTAIAGLAEIDGEALTFRGMVFSPDGAECFEIIRDGTIHDAEAVGTAAADVLLERGAGALVAGTT